MRIATWNINSVRLRQEMVADFLRQYQPDVLCLQETKTPDDQFPFDTFRREGYPYIHINGMKSYNGVAILSKYPFDKTDVYNRLGRNDCRHISAHVQVKRAAKPIEVHNLYIPAGGYEPDPVTNDKFQHKLDFVDELAAWFPANRNNKDPMIIVGDLNIAPMENDVWSHRQLLKVVSHTPIEIEKFTHMRNAFEWYDAIRHFVPEDEKLYSWWSYRSRDWEASDRGRRLDHIWVTPPLVDGLQSYEIIKEARGWERPSDHAPVILDFNP